ncbi:MAG: type II toxin-antitoxin system prevent-host-death family antitoxin [Deltaproteobacteria bacterium]|nr:type II toxin-antitoxin system prevent-host-death family antitoxin [Deltaproteobacteria bacterium]
MKNNDRDTIINSKELRNTLQEIVEGARRGRRYTVLYRSRPAFRIVPVRAQTPSKNNNLDLDPLYGAPAIGNSEHGDLADCHDDIIYGDDA